MLKTLNEKTYTNIPSPAFAEIEPKLNEMGIQYRVVKGADIPLECEAEYVEIKNKKFTRFVCVESNVDSTDLIALVEEVCFQE